jgi:hypothetical protein
MSQGRQRTLKERVEDNIVIAVVAAGVVTGTVVAGITEFLATQNEKILTANPPYSSEGEGEWRSSGDSRKRSCGLRVLHRWDLVSGAGAGGFGMGLAGR